MHRFVRKERVSPLNDLYCTSDSDIYNLLDFIFNRARRNRCHANHLYRVNPCSLFIIYDLFRLSFGIYLLLIFRLDKLIS